MSKTNPNITEKIYIKIKKSPRRNIFMRKDFEDIASYPSVSRALEQLVQLKKIVRVGTGLYARAKINRFNKKVTAKVKGGFPEVVISALNRLDINWMESDAVFQYNLGLTTQVPTNLELFVDKPISRKIGYNNLDVKMIPLSFEEMEEKKIKRKKAING